MPAKILRLPTVKERTGLSTSTIYAMMGNGNFPASVQLGARAVGWYEADMVNWLESKKYSVDRSSGLEAL